MANHTHLKYRKSWTAFTLLLIVALILCGCGQSQAAKKFRVGVLSGLGAFAPAVDGFKSKMTELGYIEGQNISYDVQSTDVDVDAYNRIAQKFVEDKVDMIFVFPTEAAMVAKAATQGTDIPVIFTMSFTDVKGIDLINSISEPGGNITGARFPSSDIASKRLEILLELVPNTKRILVPYLKDYPNVPGQLDVIRPPAAEKGIELVEIAVASPQDLQSQLDNIFISDDVGIDAILLIAEPLGITPPFYSILGSFAYEHKIPIGGAPMSIDGNYGTIFGLLPDARVAGEQAALLADKVFRGASAGTVPVTTIESYLQINYKAAQEFGLTVPDGLLKMADEVIR